MMEIDELKALIKKFADGNQVKFARMIEKSPAQVNHWLKGHRRIGVKCEMDIRAALPKGEESLSGVSVAVAIRVLASVIVVSDEATRLQLKALINKLLDEPEKAPAPALVLVMKSLLGSIGVLPPQARGQAGPAQAVDDVV